ncbi:hypothetical protein EVU96_09015 [Bacillus infantis]|uniref:hypothetical protein n=1 Tax=Bacillus infantis TaxID=324767 RepID=UPI00101E0C9E|nr:hypothetical protein [Bacillus infantis]RYI30545.1 hypothetical protein EVU96_09015 [Bacillus infantis]
MRYVIEYEHLKEDLVKNDRAKWYFDTVKNSANNYRLELSDGDFKRFLKLLLADKDIDWLMCKMSKYNVSFKDALIMYITY